MMFWAYMLHCADRTFYVGHTDNLEARIAAHQHGSLGGYTSTRLPVTLVWSSEFPTRYEALSAERQVKGWSRAKKLALIRGDWTTISALARNHEKQSASTGSARTDVGDYSSRDEPFGVGLSKPVLSQAAGDVEGALLYFNRSLRLHPDCRCGAVTRIDAFVARPANDALAITYRVSGNIADVLLPPAATRTRADELWRHTCFEAFVRIPGDAAYREFNFAPSGRWAAYRFGEYRSGMSPAEVSTPEIVACSDAASFEITTNIKPGLRPDVPWLIGLSAVIEKTNGETSYWALAHPPGPPDFHHPDCFTLELPPPTRA